MDDAKHQLLRVACRDAVTFLNTTKSNNQDALYLFAVIPSGKLT